MQLLSFSFFFISFYSLVQQHRRKSNLQGMLFFNYLLSVPFGPVVLYHHLCVCVCVCFNIIYLWAKCKKIKGLVPNVLYEITKTVRNSDTYSSSMGLTLMLLSVQVFLPLKYKIQYKAKVKPSNR